jgi:hypothetical protein
LHADGCHASSTVNHILCLVAPMPPQLLHHYCDYLKAAASAANPLCTELTATSRIASASVWPDTRQEEQQLLSFLIMMFMMCSLFFLSYLQLLWLLFLWLFLLFSLLLLLLLSLLPACLMCGCTLQLFVAPLFRRLLVG